MAEIEANPPMSFWEHLEAFRWVLFKSAGALAVATLLGFLFIPDLLGLLQLPLHRLGGRVELVFAAPMDAFMIQFKMALLAGVAMALPFMLYFLWGFVTPALHAHERRAGGTAAGAAVLLFLAGATAGYGLLFFTLPVLASFGLDGVRQLWNYRQYIDFCFVLIFGTGLAFEFPLVLLTLVRLGLLSVPALRRARPYAVVGALVVAAVITPTTDVVTQAALAVPLWLLYEATLVVAALTLRPPVPDASPNAATPLAEQE
ncbi:MAG: twin-arginine translocase subunit TatC [Lentisphaeria bacterium]